MSATAVARRRSAGRAGPEPVPAGGDVIIRCVIRASDQPSGPIIYPPSSRTIARLRAKAEDAARTAEAARVLRAQVQPGLKPPPGQLFASDLGALVLRGPNGGLGSTEKMVRTLVPLAAGGRHPPAVLMAAGGWADEGALREALAGLAPKLGALGLRVCRRKAGLRMAKLKQAR